MEIVFLRGIIDIFFLSSCLDQLGCVTCSNLELIRNYGSYRQTVGLLGMMVSPVTRPLHTENNKNTEKRGQTSMLRVGLKPTIPVFKWAKILHTLGRFTPRQTGRLTVGRNFRPRISIM
jgi:hypothetical protein